MENRDLPGDFLMDYSARAGADGLELSWDLCACGS